MEVVMEKREIIRLAWAQARKIANREWGWYGKNCFGWKETAGNYFQGALLSARFSNKDAWKLRRLYIN